MDIDQAIARRNNAEPDAARRLLERALAAEVRPSQSTASIATLLFDTE